ncbi:uncharacterized protein [Diadema setosum]|uniref:uncharacterized protein n=1 Tax=Diadema setosum TaxID=31175 RepID=UPI003B3AE864
MSRDRVVDTVSSVQGWKGEDIRLPCHFQGEPAAVFWVKESVLHQQVLMAKFIDGNFESLEKGFDMDRNFNLVISDVKMADEGLYLCQVLLKNLDNFENSVHLTVSLVDIVPSVQGWKGEDIRLPCHFQGVPESVVWVKESILYQPAPKAKFINGNFRSLEKGFDMGMNFNLVISDVKMADEGLYLCQVLLKNLDNFENSVHLTVNSMASKHTIENCVTESKSRQSKCTYRPPNTSFITLTCVVSGFMPDVSLMWTDESGKRLQSMASQETTLSDDTYERFEEIEVSVKRGTERTFMCIATGDTVNGTSTKRITLLPVLGERDIVGLIIGLVIGIPSAVTILVLLAARFWQKCDRNFMPQRVSKELISTVQTTVNSEDESRKWYSVQWADFKLCCRRLRDVSTQHARIPFWLYAFYRTGLAAYFFVFFIAYVVLGVKAMGGKFFIYLPVWTYTASVCYVCLAFFNVAMDFVKNKGNPTIEDKVRYQIQWCLFNIAAASCPLVTGGIWIGVYDFISANQPIFIIVYISVDILPTVVCFMEIFLTLIVVRFVHVVYPGFYLIIYLFFTVIYWAAGGTDQFGYPAISPNLDYEYYPGIATASVFGATLAVLLALAVFKGLYTLRVRLIDTVSSVQGWKGEDILLPCHFQGEPATVAWVKESVLHQQVPKAQFVDGNFESLEESDGI